MEAQKKEMKTVEEGNPLLCRSCGAKMKLERFYTPRFDFWRCTRCVYWDCTGMNRR